MNFRKKLIISCHTLWLSQSSFQFFVLLLNLTQFTLDICSHLYKLGAKLSNGHSDLLNHLFFLFVFLRCVDYRCTDLWRFLNILLVCRLLNDSFSITETSFFGWSSRQASNFSLTHRFTHGLVFLAWNDASAPHICFRITLGIFEMVCYTVSIALFWHHRLTALRLHVFIFFRFGIYFFNML